MEFTPYFIITWKSFLIGIVVGIIVFIRQYLRVRRKDEKIKFIWS